MHFLIDGDRLLNQTKKLEVVKSAAGPVRLTIRQVTRVAVGMWLLPAECCRDK
jgi:hypothetical protein